jgi:tetratricopeptide (TPR) repeat protein
VVGFGLHWEVIVRHFRPVAFLLALASCAVPARAAEPTWTSVTSANFVLIGDASERDIRQVALQLEQFRETLGRLLPAARVPSETPTIVYVFSTDKAYRPYKPLYKGKPMDVAGYFVRPPDANFVALPVERGQEGFPIIFHEYTHLLLSHAIKSPPIWLGEGLAEYYSTFRLVSDGRQAQIGRPIDYHVLLLREHFLPLADLLTVGRQSPLYNESDARSILYAESWAWIHFLLMGDPPRTRQLMALVNAQMAGTPVDAAFRSAFGTDPATFQAELLRYVRGAAYRSVLFTFDARVSPAEQMKASTLTPAETDAAAGDLLAQVGRLDEAETRLSAAMQRDPGLAQTLTALGALRLRQKRQQDALELFRQASAKDPVGVAGRRARTWLDTLEPRRRAGTGTPASPPASTPAPPPSGTPAPPPGSTPAPRAESSNPSASAAAPRTAPVLRLLKEGEQRAEGTLEEIECGPGGIVIRMKTGERTLRVSARRFEDVEFITYRDDLSGSVLCGPRTPPDRVYVTWRPTSARQAQASPPTDGEAVAVEFLPKRTAQ